MPRYFAFLRAINVGRGRTVKMDILRRVFEELGFSRVETIIASGNVVFETNRASAASLEKKIERGLVKAVGFEVETFVRTGDELAAIAALEPFPPAKRDAAAELNVIFLKAPPGEATARRVRLISTESDEFRVQGREVYWLRRRKAPGLYSTADLEKALDGPFTARAMKTIQKMAATDVGGSHAEKKRS